MEGQLPGVQEKTRKRGEKGHRRERSPLLLPRVSPPRMHSYLFKPGVLVMVPQRTRMKGALGRAVEVATMMGWGRSVGPLVGRPVKKGTQVDLGVHPRPRKARKSWKRRRRLSSPSLSPKVAVRKRLAHPPKSALHPKAPGSNNLWQFFTLSPPPPVVFIIIFTTLITFHK